MNCPKVLVGLKSDLRDKMCREGDTDMIVCEGCGMWEAKEYKFSGYVECSSKLFDNCGAVFSEAIKHAKRFENFKDEERHR